MAIADSRRRALGAVEEALRIVGTVLDRNAAAVELERHGSYDGSSLFEQDEQALHRAIMRLRFAATQLNEEGLT